MASINIMWAISKVSFSLYSILSNPKRGPSDVILPFRNYSNPLSDAFDSKFADKYQRQLHDCYSAYEKQSSVKYLSLDSTVFATNIRQVPDPLNIIPLLIYQIRAKKKSSSKSRAKRRDVVKKK